MIDRDYKKVNKDKSLKNNSGRTMFGLAVVANIVYIIAVPIVLFTLIGNYLDNKWNKDFAFILIGGGLGIGLGMYGVYKKADEIKRKFYANSKEK